MPDDLVFHPSEEVPASRTRTRMTQLEDLRPEGVDGPAAATTGDVLPEDWGR